MCVQTLSAEDLDVTAEGQQQWALPRAALPQPELKRLLSCVVLWKPPGPLDPLQVLKAPCKADDSRCELGLSLIHI